MNKQQIFKVQKKCIRVMFGDKEQYLHKFKTCARCREPDKQILTSEYYCKENTKPLFKSHSIMTVHNIYNYHCFMEIFKILRFKFRMPISIYSEFNISKRKEAFLITPVPSTDFIYKSSSLWNSLRVKLGIHDFSINISLVKTKLKSLILAHQHSGRENVWNPENLII